MDLLKFLSWGKDASEQVAIGYTPQNLDDEEEGDEEEVIVLEEVVERSVRSHLSDGGLFFTHKTKENWILIFSCFLNSKIAIEKFETNGLTIALTSAPPSVSYLQEISNITKIQANEYSFQEKKCEIFVPSPYPINQDQEKVK